METLLPLSGLAWTIAYLVVGILLSEFIILQASPSADRPALQTIGQYIVLTLCWPIVMLVAAVLALIVTIENFRG